MILFNPEIKNQVYMKYTTEQITDIICDKYTKDTVTEMIKDAMDTSEKNRKLFEKLNNENNLFIDTNDVMRNVAQYLMDVKNGMEPDDEMEKFIDDLNARKLIEYGEFKR